MSTVKATGGQSCTRVKLAHTEGRNEAILHKGECAFDFDRQSLVLVQFAVHADVEGCLEISFTLC